MLMGLNEAQKWQMSTKSIIIWLEMSLSLMRHTTTHERQSLSDMQNRNSIALQSRVIATW